MTPSPAHPTAAPVDLHSAAAEQALRRLEPMGGVVARRPVVERGLELLLEPAEREPAPIEQAVTLSFRPAEQFDIEHWQVR